VEYQDDDEKYAAANPCKFNAAILVVLGSPDAHHRLEPKDCGSLFGRHTRDYLKIASGEGD
jgi:hypothetical protein